MGTSGGHVPYITQLRAYCGYPVQGTGVTVTGTTNGESNNG